MLDLAEINGGRPPHHIGSVIVGPPGTGKSFAVDYMVKTTNERYPNIILNIAATTGAASSRLESNSTTLATFLGVGGDAMKLDKLDEILPVILAKRPDKILTTNVLIIEESSMLSKRQFDNLNEICCATRESPDNFGGIYIIVVGDPLQLPPVPHDAGPGLLRKTCEFVPSCLERNMQGYNYIVANEMKRADGDYLLQKILLGCISSNVNERKNALQLLHDNRYKSQMTVDEVLELQERTGATILTGSRASVAEYNTAARVKAQLDPDYEEFTTYVPQKLHQTLSAQLLKEVRSLLGGDIGIKSEEDTIIKRDSWAPDNILRKGSLYMIRLNMKTLEEVSVTNGDTGKVLGYNAETHIVTFQLSRTGQTVTFGPQKFLSEWANDIGFMAIPLIEASAMTVHKAQGATLANGIILEARHLYAGEGYLAHMVYTALSRVKSLNQVYLASILTPELLNRTDVQKKLEYIWKLNYMRDYLVPSKINTEAELP